MKFVITITGPTMMYRLDLIKKSSPNIIKDYLIIFTDGYSYNLYAAKNYHHDFNFVIIDDIRNKFPISLEYERILELPTEEEYFKNLHTFYSNDHNKLYPYDIHRFILPYLAEHNILNFAIIDSDMILNNDVGILKKYFESIPKSYLYMPHQGDFSADQVIDGLAIFTKNQHLYPDINFNVEHLLPINNCDGWIKGFHFSSNEDMLLFFNMWNVAVEEYHTGHNHSIGGGNIIRQLNFLCPAIMRLFNKNKGYKFECNHRTDTIDNKKCFRHCTRPEDTFYFGNRGGWQHFGFDYSDNRTISNFIKNNKRQLREYYNNHIPIIDITDTHVYTTIDENL